MNSFCVFQIKKYNTYAVLYMAEIINPLQPGVTFLYTEDIRKPKAILMFSGVTEKQQRAVMG